MREPSFREFFYSGESVSVRCRAPLGCSSDATYRFRSPPYVDIPLNPDGGAE